MSSGSLTGKQAMASEKNSKGSEATRSILQDVCSDFETMNVVAPKSNKVGVIRNFRTRSAAQQSSVQKHPSTNVLKGRDTTPSTSVEKPPSPMVNREVSNKTSVTKDTYSNRSVLVTEVAGRKSSTFKTSESSATSGTEHLQSSVSSSAVSVATELPQSFNLNTEFNNSEFLPLNNCQATSNVAIVPESFAVDTNLTSIAQLADAEIIQSGDNVSIIVSNPRFIEVLESGVLEANIDQNQQIELLDSPYLTDNTFQNLTIADDLNLINEEVTSQRSGSSKASVQSNVKSPKKDGRGRGRPPKSAAALRKSAESPPLKYIPSTHFPKGRRITARMKAAWTKLLEMDGRLVCQMPGCSQTFVTVANFQTHFKYCTGKKTLVKCDYCDSMIFSTHKAVLQHMEVEHPEKADEYRAAHQEEILEFEKNNAPDHIIIAEDENVAMNIEEVTQGSTISRKRKLSEKESALPNKKVILKHKLQSIQNSMAENAKEFKKCVRFDSITDAIKSVKISSLEEACQISEVTAMRTKPDRRIKRVFNEKIVSADKYFEDDEDVDQPKSKEEEEQQKEKDQLREKMHTKARLMLNLERYKRYQEYLTVTRDWSSERRTYSRSRGSDASAENSYSSQMLNDSFQDIHRLNNMIESSDISLNNPEAEINSIQLPPVETYQVVETPQFVSAVSIQPDPGEPDVLTSTPKGILNLSSNESDYQLIYGENRVRRETCYNRVNFETPKPKPRLGGIITYGAKIPGEKTTKSVESPVTFDSLVNFIKPKTARRNSQVEDIENIPKPAKEEIVKLSNGKDVNVIVPKKRGRPPKCKVDSSVDSKNTKAAQKTQKFQKGRAKKYSAAMLKTIERNVKNKKVSRLFGIKKKIKSKKYSTMQSKKINLKNIRLKQAKNKSIVKEIGSKKKKHKTKAVDVSAIQCQENIDNNLSVQGINISDITTDRSYTSTLNQLIVDANIAGEIEIVASNTEHVLETVADRSEIAPENVSVNASLKQINKETESADISDLTKTNSQVSEEKQSLVEAETDTVIKEKLNDIDTNQSEILQSKKSADSEILVQKDKDEYTNLVQNDTEISKTCLKLVGKDTESNDTSLTLQEKEIENSTTSDDLLTVQNNQLENTASDKLITMNLDSGKEQLNMENAILNEVHKMPQSVTHEGEQLATQEVVCRAMHEVEHPAMQEVEQAAAQEVEQPAAQEVEQSEAQEVVQPVTQEVVQPAAEDVEQPAAQEVKQPATQEMEQPATQEVEQPATQEVEQPATQEVKQPATQEVKQPTTQEVEQPVTQEVEQPVAREVEQPAAQEVEQLVSQEMEQPAMQEGPQHEASHKMEDIPPEVPVKRGRGRPRKNSSKQAVLKVSKTKSSQQNTVQDHESEEPKVTENNTNICTEVKDSSVISQTSVVDNSVSDDNKTVPIVRKSERVRRRKLVDEKTLHTPTVESKQKEEATPTDSVLEVTPQSKRRGRRRKNQIQESPQEIPETEDSQQKTPEIEVVESEIVDENLRKFSRKGRPRKCVRYADLNSGLESSESMDGTQSAATVGKDKSESKKDKIGKNAQKTQISQEVTELPMDSKEQEETIVLPLKKRKQRHTKKNDSESGKVKQGKIIDEEILLSDEENQNNLEEHDDASEKRTLRSRKRGTKRKKTDSSDEEWDPEVHLKSSGKSSGRKSQLDILELEESSDSSCSERRDPAFSKKESDTIRRLAAKTAKTKRLDIVAAKYSLKTSDKLFMEYKPQKWMWKILSGDDYFLPPMKISSYFKIENAWSKTEAYWNTLNLFDSMPLDKDSCHGTFFTGGPITCSAWCPTPVEKNKVQHVALAVSSIINKLHSCICEEPERGFLQLWNIGDLSNKMLQRKPFIEMSISHKYGPINDMAWCPYGCWENPEIEATSDILPRLGLLAVACSDSYIRIYSIPHPHLLPKEGTNYPIYSAYPSVVLESLCGDMCLVTKKSACLTLSWQRSDHCDKIAAGYGCGMICIWHVNSSATVLAVKENNQITIKPYLVFNGHGTPVLGLSFSPLPGGRYLVSASIDKTLKFWDLIDTSLPLYTMKKGAGKCAHWSSYYCGAFGNIQHGMNNYKGASFFKECGTEAISSRSLSHASCSIILSSVSDWLSALAIGDNAGNVSVSFTHSLIHEHVKGPQYFQRHVYQTELKPVEGIVEKILFSSYPESVNCIETIQEMKQTSLLLDEIVSLVSGLIDIVDTSVIQNLEKHSKESCLMTLNDASELVSVVDHIVENCKSVAKDIAQEDADVQEEFMQECHMDAEEETKLEEIVPNKLSLVTEVVTLITDINDVTDTVDELMNLSQKSVLKTKLSSSTNDVISSDISMEVDDSKDLCESGELNSDLMQSSLEIVQLVDSLINTTDQNEHSHDIKELLNRSEKVTSENVITDIHSEGIVCISAVEEMSNVVTVVESMTEECSKLDASNISFQTAQSKNIACISAVEEMSSIITVVENLTESCSKPELINEIYGIMSEKQKEAQSSQVEIVGHVLQNIKDVIFITEEMAKSFSKAIKYETDTNLNGFDLSQPPLINNLVMPFTQITSAKNEHERFPLDLSEIVDVVSAVSDLQDVTDALLSLKGTVEVVSAKKEAAETILDMKDTTEVVCDLKTVTEMVSDMKDVISSSDDLEDVISSTENLKDITVVTEKLENEVTDSRLSECAISSLVNEIVENVSKEKDDESEATRVMNSLISNIQKVIKSIGLENKESSQTFTGGDIILNEKSVYSTEMIDEINENIIKSNNNLIKIFDYELHDLPDEVDEQMLSADSDSCSSDNEIDTEDEMEMDNSYMFDQDSNLSDDSILSERSLDSAASIYSFSSESELSVDSEQEIDDLISNNPNNVSDAGKAPRSPSKIADLTFESRIVPSVQNFSVESNSENVITSVLDSVSDSSAAVIETVSDFTKPKSLAIPTCLGESVSDSTKPSDISEDLTINVLDSTKASDYSGNPTTVISDYTKPSNSCTDLIVNVLNSATSADSAEGHSVNILDSTKSSDSSACLTTNCTDSTNPIKNSNEETTMEETNLCTVPVSNVSNPQDSVLSEDKPTSETVDKAYTSEVEQVCSNSEINTEILDLAEPNTVVPSDTVSVNSSNEPDISDASNVLSEMACDNNISTAEAAEIVVDSSSETCIESADKIVDGIAVETLRENLPDDYNSILPETIESTPESNEIAVIDQVESEQIQNSKNNYTHTQAEPCLVNKKITPKKFSSYEDVISEYGIVFTDMNTAKFDQIEQQNFELDNYSLNRYDLTAIRTVSWNPNHGSHHWLLSAGQSGIARLSYISDMLQANSDKKAK